MEKYQTKVLTVRTEHNLVHSPSLIERKEIYIKRLLTEREVCMEKYQTKVLTVWIENSLVHLPSLMERKQNPFIYLLNITHGK